MRIRTRPLPTRLGAPRPEELTRALDAELVTRVAHTLRAVPLDMLRSGDDAKNFERFARLLTNGTPYQAQADALASDGRLGTQFGRRLSHLAEMAGKRGVGLEELLRKQPAAVMDYVIERDYRSLEAALKATKNPVAQAPTARAARDESLVAAVAPEVERDDRSLLAALKAKAPVTQASTSGAEHEASPKVAVAPPFKRDLRDPASAAQEWAAIERRREEMESATAALKATSTRLTQASTSSDARVDSLLAAVTTELERDDRSVRDALAAMKDRMTQALAATDESMQTLLAAPASLKATKDRVTQASAASDERIASVAAVVAALEATRRTPATQAPRVIPELEEWLPAAIAPRVD